MEQGERVIEMAQSEIIGDTQTLPVEHIYEDEHGNVCAVLLDPTDVTYMPMMPVEATEEVVLYDGIRQDDGGIKIELDESYAVIYPDGYPEQDVTDDEAKGQKKNVRRGGEHVCKVCHKTFSQPINLVTHQRIHTGEKPFVCSICMKAFSQQPNLWKHMRTHTGERPYQCVTCKKRFTQQANLSKHIRIHTGERPYSCNYCGRRFTQQANLTKHIRLHTGERPFQCRFCAKTFVQQSNLERHERIHTGVKPFKCTICFDSFAQNAHLTKHLRTIHKAVPGASYGTYYVKTVRPNSKANGGSGSGGEELRESVAVEEEQSSQDSPKKIGIPVIYCTKTHKIIKRVE